MYDAGVMTTEQTKLRDYSLIGLESKAAIEKGLADAEWYTTPIPRDKMKELLTRKNGPAIRDTLLWFGLIIGSGALVYLWWGTWFVIFPYIVYSVLYASSSDSRWHESSHGTAFKSDWMNNALYEISSFMVLRQSTVWRWSHARHHSDTIIRGRDPEIAIPRPPDIKKILLVFVGISSSVPELKKLLTHASGKIDPQVATYVPESDYRKVIFKARIYTMIFLSVIALSIIYGTILPLMYIGLPTILGSWLMPVYGFTQHAGLQENVLDHRLNCRTVYMNRIHRFLYWNMNYHVEHHMFPLVPYHALPRLHELMKHDCPKPYNGIIETYKEIIPTIFKQVKDPWYHVKRELPETAHSATQKADKIYGSDAIIRDGRVEICAVNELPEGDIIRFDFEQRTYAVYHAGGRYYATDGICTHGNTHLSTGVILGDVVECPKHNGRFKIKNGSPQRQPVCVGLKTHKVEEENGKLYMLSDNLNTRDEEQDSETVACKVISNNNLTPYIKELVLQVPDGQSLSFIPGQYVQFIIPPYKTGFKAMEVAELYVEHWKKTGLFDLNVVNEVFTKRNFSFANTPCSDPLLTFNVRLSLPPAGSRYNPGIGSSYIFSLRSGDEVKLCIPQGDFLIKESDREMIYIGGGAGMAPLKSHLTHLFKTLKTKRKVSFWYGARASSDLFYEGFFKSIEDRFNNFQFRVALSEPGNEKNWKGDVGFIHEVLYEQYLKHHKTPENVEYYMCGPPALIDATLKMLKQLKVSEDRIAYDEFN